MNFHPILAFVWVQLLVISTCLPYSIFIPNPLCQICMPFHSSFIISINCFFPILFHHPSNASWIPLPAPSPFAHNSFHSRLHFCHDAWIFSTPARWVIDELKNWWFVIYRCWFTRTNRFDGNLHSFTGN